MKKTFIALFLVIAPCFALFAQNKGNLTKVFLQDGTTFSAYVEKQTDGGYKLTTEDGSIFFFYENEIKSISDNAYIKPKENLKYWEMKTMYSAKDYRGRKLGDKYNPAGVGIASILIPGLGQYITGTNVGIGVMQTVLGLAGIAGTIYHAEDMLITASREDLADLCSKYTIATIASASIWVGMATWSCCSAVKAAKIKNLYYRDIRNGVAYRFDVTPYVDVTAPVLASNQNMVAGLSFRVSF